MAVVQQLGAAVVWECTKCNETHVGVPGTKTTRAWITFHNKHVQTHRGVWYVPGKDD